VNGPVSAAPVTAAPSLAPVAPRCSICEGRIIGNPDGTIGITGQPLVSCQELQTAGDEGQILAADCEKLPELTSDVCNCEASQSPVAPSAPTDVT
jgi:hypothetical protein